MVSVARGIAVVSASSATVLAALQRGGGSKGSSGKRWVRTDDPEASGEPAHQPSETTTVVRSFAEIDQLLQSAISQAG
jgi:hypothetical protein